jgi:hypothetical protein
VIAVAIKMIAGAITTIELIGALYVIAYRGFTESTQLARRL